MAIKWELYGPEQDRFTLAEAALRLGYESADTVRRLVAEGKLPAPRGHGAGQYYTGLDMAIIDEMFGRWAPAPQPPVKGDEKPQKTTKGDEKPQSQ